MEIKECYVSHNGISCFTNINSLVNVKNIEFKSIVNNNIINNIINKNSVLFYIGLRCCEFIIKDFIKNKNYLLKQDDIIPSIVFS